MFSNMARLPLQKSKGSRTEAVLGWVWLGLQGLVLVWCLCETLVQGYQGHGRSWLICFPRRDDTSPPPPPKINKSATHTQKEHGQVVSSDSLLTAASQSLMFLSFCWIDYDHRLSTSFLHRTEDIKVAEDINNLSHNISFGKLYKGPKNKAAENGWTLIAKF